MGCANSTATVDEVEAVRKCKERKRLMKQLLSRRSELAAAYIAYFRSLRNTGATLRQLAELETVLLTTGSSPVHHTSHYSRPTPPPPNPHPPYPPPPPIPLSLPSSPSLPSLPHLNFSSSGKGKRMEEYDADSVDDSDSCRTPLPPPPPDFDDWENWDPRGYMANMGSPLILRMNNYKQMAANVGVEDDSWEEASTVFDEEGGSIAAGNANIEAGHQPAVPLAAKAFHKEHPIDDISSVSSHTNDWDEESIEPDSNKTLVSIVSEIDEYFLKATESGKDILLLLESNKAAIQVADLEGAIGRSSRSSKVFTWNLSFRSPALSREASGMNSCDEDRCGYHGRTIEKLHEEEIKLHKQVKESEMAMMQYTKNTSLLQNMESRNGDMLYMERIRENLEELQIRIISLQESVSSSCASISKIRDQELYPQLIELAAGLVHMWRIMHNCHQAQSHVAHQISLLGNHRNYEPTTDSHCHAAVQLEKEVSSWHSSFCNLFRLQREYMGILSQWIRLTDCLPDNDGLMCSSSGILVLCEGVQFALDKISEKAAAEAIKNFASAIRSVVQQQNEERQLKKKVEQLERKLEKQVSTLGAAPASASAAQNLFPPSKSATRVESFKKRVEEEKARYCHSVRSSRAMTLDHLSASLSNVFQALTAFTAVSIQAFEKINSS